MKTCNPVTYRSALIAIFSILAIITPLHALVRVTPAIVEAKLENGRTSGSFVVANSGGEPVRVRATPVYFRLTPDGQIQNMPQDEFALTNWIKITPREFDLAGNAERQIRYAVVAPDSVPDGAYWGGIEFMPLPSAAESLAARSMIRGIASIMVPIMAEKGNATYSWRLVEDSLTSVPTAQGVTLIVPVHNDGSGRIPQTGVYEIRNSVGAVVHTGEFQHANVFPRSTRYLRTTLSPDFPAGQYDMAFTLTSEVDGSTVSGAMRFDVPSALPAAEKRTRR